MGTTATPLYGFLRPDSDSFAFQLGDDMGATVDRLEQVLSGFVTSPDVSDLNAEVLARTNADTALGTRATALEGRATALETGRAMAVVRRTAADPGMAGQSASQFASIPWLGQGVVKDTHGGFVWNTGAAATGTTWTCPAGQGGTYVVDGKVNFSSLVQCTCRIVKNGASFIGCTGAHGGSNINAILGMKMVDLVPGDTLAFQGWVNVAGWAVTVDASIGATSELTIVRVR